MATEQDIIREFLVALGFKVDQKGLKDFSGSVEQATKGVVKMVAAIEAGALSIGAGVAAMASHIEQLSFAALRSQGLAKPRGDVFVMPLSEAAKGKLSLGEVTLLFQFVNPPKALPKMELPQAARGSLLNTIDRTFTGVLMFFLVLEFAGAGALARLPLPSDDVSLDELPDRFVKMVVPEKKPEPPKPPEDTTKPQEAKNDKKVEPAE